MPPPNFPVPVDLQIDAGWLLRVEPVEPLHAHSVIVQRGAIVDVLPTRDAASRYLPSRRDNLSDHIVMPGLVNAHCHAAMTLLRGIADDLPLQDWLQSHIWPRETAHVSPEFVESGSQLAAVEMIRGGITTCCDMYFYPDATASALRGAGMRVQLGLPVLEFPSAYAPNADAYLQRGLEVRDRLGDDPLISFALAPHAPYTVSDATFAKIVTYAEELALPIQTHLHETANEISDGFAAFGSKPLARIAALGALGPGFMAIHAVHCDADDLAQLARNACHVAHCPTSNLKLGSGIAPVARMLAAGINVALGTDGAASNNRLDMFGEMRIAALIAKGQALDPTLLPARVVVDMATMGGAKALGLDDKIGSIAIGKDADLIAVSTTSPEMSPLFDPYSHLVFAAGRNDVTHAWVAGHCILKDRLLTGCDLPAILRRTKFWQERLRTTDEQ
ncbi:MAG: TRZ/ATZ family hydrolase [Casimicrobiaceae bacterium]